MSGRGCPRKRGRALQRRRTGSQRRSSDAGAPPSSEGVPGTLPPTGHHRGRPGCWCMNGRHPGISHRPLITQVQRGEGWASWGGKLSRIPPRIESCHGLDHVDALVARIAETLSQVGQVDSVADVRARTGSTFGEMTGWRGSDRGDEDTRPHADRPFDRGARVGAGPQCVRPVDLR